ncbi:MFS transporter [Longispora sp. K20-0274]|uniref:MFS transporter n=1 Tax=Longispora sp. K20-0274 TaxID=3088255 RepID=UPI00399A3B2A
MTGLLRGNRDFGRFWWGQALSALGSRISDICLPLLLLHLTGSAVAAGGLATVRLVVLNVARLPAGVLADRWRRRTVMIRVDLVKAVLWAGPAVMLATGARAVWPLLLIAGLDGLVSSVYNPSLGGALRALVGSDQLTRAVSLNETRTYAAGLLGPAIGGALFALWPWAPFVLDVATFVACAVLVAGIGGDLGGGAPRSAGGMLADIGTGLRFVAGQPFLRVVTVWSSVLNFATAGAFFGLVPMLRAHGTTPTLIGVLAGTVSVGALVGAALAPRLVTDRPYTAVLTSGVGAVAVTTFVAVAPYPVPTAVGLALLSAMGPVLVIALTAHTYRLVPDDLMGRAQSSMTLIGSVLYPFAFVTMGWLLQRFGPQAGYGTMAACLGLCAALCTVGPVRAQLTAPAPAHAGQPLRSRRCA